MGLDFSIIGELTNTKRLEIEYNDEIAGSIPIHALEKTLLNIKDPGSLTNYQKKLN